MAVTVLYSCNKQSKASENNDAPYAKRILQQEDGTISLIVDKAECYQDKVNPATNTAEWNIFVSKSGRFDVWLSSATKDTTNLQYKHSVMLSIQDNRLEAHPGCDRIIRNSSEVSYPYFRADSFMGSLYIQDTGMYNIQVISEKINPRNFEANESAGEASSKLISVFLTPITQ